MESMADVLSFVNRQKVSHAIIIKRRSRTDAWCLRFQLERAIHECIMNISSK